MAHTYFRASMLDEKEQDRLMLHQTHKRVFYFCVKRNIMIKVIFWTENAIGYMRCWVQGDCFVLSFDSGFVSFGGTSLFTIRGLHNRG